MELVPFYHMWLADGSERPIAYASRSLIESEKNYAHLEKEAMSLVFGIKNFINIFMEEVFS